MKVGVPEQINAHEYAWAPVQQAWLQRSWDQLAMYSRRARFEPLLREWLFLLGNSIWSICPELSATSSLMFSSAHLAHCCKTS